MINRNLHRFALISGCVWAVIAFVLGYGSFERLILGGLLASPLIGLAVGGIAARFKPNSTVRRAVLSLLDLYLAAGLFGLGVGVFDAATGHPGRIQSAVVVQSIFGVIWGVTFTGYVFILWPLAYLNHALLWNRISIFDDITVTDAQGR